MNTTGNSENKNKAAEPAENKPTPRGSAAAAKKAGKPKAPAGAEPPAKKKTGAGKPAGRRAAAAGTKAKTSGAAQAAAPSAEKRKAPRKKAAPTPAETAIAPPRPLPAADDALAEPAEKAEQAETAERAETAARVEEETKAVGLGKEPVKAIAHKPDLPELVEATGNKAAQDHAQAAPAASGEGVAVPAAPKQTAPDAARAAEDTVEALSAEEQARVATITRTAQLSIEKILAGVAERETATAKAQAQAQANPPKAPAPMEPKPVADFARDLGERVGSGLWGMTKWLLLVVLFITVIAGSGVYWLYQKATPASIPSFTATFDGATLETSSYHWNVPVVGEIITRSYSDKNKEANATPVEVKTAHPGITVSPSGYTTELTVKDAAGEECFDGTLEDYRNYIFATNADYTATLTVSQAASKVSGASQISGKQIYRFAFTVKIEPTIRLSTTTVLQGGVLAVRVSGLPAGSTAAPTLESALGNVPFSETDSGWVAFLPIAYNLDPHGDYSVAVTAGSYTETLAFSVRERSWLYQDYNSSSRLVSPHIGVEDTPDAVKKLLTTADSKIYWATSGFVQPFLSKITIKMNYGTMEYAGRSRDQISKNINVNGRAVTNVLLTCDAGESLIAPADGRVLLAQDLGGDAGNTVVIEHGAGVKSIFYRLASLSVKADQAVRQGQQLGTTSKTMIGEVRVGQTPVEPLSIWRSQNDALLYL